MAKAAIIFREMSGLKISQGYNPKPWRTARSRLFEAGDERPEDCRKEEEEASADRDGDVPGRHHHFCATALLVRVSC